MTKLELLEIIQNGENSGIEFIRDDRGNKTFSEGFAKEVVALSNLKGGKIIIGVEDDGSISGLVDLRFEEWVMNVCRTLVRPGIIPYYEEIQIDSGKRVAVVHIDMGFSKPYSLERGERRKYYIRVGSTSREATIQELGRLFQESGIYHYDVAPVPQTTFDNLDKEKLGDYFNKLKFIDIQNISKEDLILRLINADIMKSTDYGKVATVGGLLIFGKKPEKSLPQSTITFVHFKGNEITADLLDKKEITGTLPELIDKTVLVIKINLNVQSTVKGLKRIEYAKFPDEVLREAVTNAVAHRDYSIFGANIRIFMFDNRIEFRSPGKLPNTVTIEKMKEGYSVARNPFIVKYLQNYQYIDQIGSGIPMILKQMKILGAPEPLLKEEGEEFILTLFPE
ncbi:MAG TPA: ATP-binding protein [Candidatus Brocadiaceae bacterium]|nr:ATP-binding protein [Candidatus Brocadiaceae bacterium]